MEKGVELLYFVAPWQFAFGYAVEFFFYARREVVVEYVGEIFGQEVVDYGFLCRLAPDALFRTGGFISCFGLYVGCTA